MKKKAFIFIVIGFVAVIACLIVLLINKNVASKKEQKSDELLAAEELFDLRKNSSDDEYIIYGLKKAANQKNKTIVIPDAIDNIPVTKIISADKDFSDYSNIDKIVIGKNITYIGDNLLESTTDPTNLGNDILVMASSLTAIEVDDNNAKYKSVDGVLYSKDGQTLIKYPNAKQNLEQAIDAYTILDGTKIIYQKAFYLNLYLDTIYFCDSVESIEDNAFGFANRLVNAYFNDGIKKIGYSAFEHCDSLDTINLPKDLVSLEGRAFINCLNLVNVYIGPNLETIGHNCFQNCNKLVNIYTEVENVDNLTNKFEILGESKIAELVKNRS